MRNLTIVCNVTYQGGQIILKIIDEANEKPLVEANFVDGTVLASKLFTFEPFTVRREQEGRYYIEVLADQLHGSETSFKSPTFNLSVIRKPSTPNVTLVSYGGAFITINWTISPEPNYRYDKITQFGIQYSTKWGERVYVNTSNFRRHVDGLDPSTLYSLSVIAYGNHTKSNEGSSLAIRTDFNPERPIHYFSESETGGVYSNASGPLFAVCDKNHSLGNCTRAVIETKDLFMVFSTWCYEIRFNATASLRTLKLANEEHPDVVLCDFCEGNRLRKCHGSCNNKLWMGMGIGIGIGIGIGFVLWVIVCLLS
eukprot:m.164388 g.164388  ORF g.164388 m.164388 type:complete len:311 (+) comp38874_c0_seq5:1675-2607(+)